MIRVDDLQKHYGAQEVLKGVSFHVREGTITTIMGLSGSGKSVLIRHLIGLEIPDRGGVYIRGENIVGMKARELNRIRRSFGVLFQEAALFDSLSVAENVAFPLREHFKISNREIRDIVEDRLTQVGMNGHEEKFPAQLSGGMRRRVGLARALVLDPDIVFFDEPTTGLDPVTASSIFGLIDRTHRQRTMTYVLVSHDIQGALEVSDQIMFLVNGRITEAGTPQDMSRSSDPIIQQFFVHCSVPNGTD